MALLSALAIPMLSALNKAGQLNTATAAIATLLEQARAYAMANNTYVFVGFEETDFSSSSTQLQTPGTGRVAVQIFSSLDGTLNVSTANLAPLSRIRIFNSLDLPPSLASSTGTLSGHSTVRNRPRLHPRAHHSA